MKGAIEIQQEIRSLRGRLNDLHRELELARGLEAIQAEQNARRRDLVRRVLDRFKSGWWVAGAPRLWWCRAGVPLVERVTPDEYEALEALRRHGVLTRSRSRGEQ